MSEILGAYLTAVGPSVTVTPKTSVCLSVRLPAKIPQNGIPVFLTPVHGRKSAQTQQPKKGDTAVSEGSVFCQGAFLGFLVCCYALFLAKSMVPPPPAVPCHSASAAPPCFICVTLFFRNLFPLTCFSSFFSLFFFSSVQIIPRICSWCYLVVSDTGWYIYHSSLVPFPSRTGMILPCALFLVRFLPRDAILLQPVM